MGPRGARGRGGARGAAAAAAAIAVAAAALAAAEGGAGGLNVTYELNATAEARLGEALEAAPSGVACLGSGSEPGPPGPAGGAEICGGVPRWADCSRARCQEYEMFNNGSHVEISAQSSVIVVGDVHHYPEGTVYVQCECELRGAPQGEEGGESAGDAVGIPVEGVGAPCLLDFASGPDLCTYMQNGTVVAALEPEPWMGARGRAGPSPADPGADAGATSGGGFAVCPPSTPFAYCFGALCTVQGIDTVICDCPLVAMPEGTAEDQVLLLAEEWCPSTQDGEPLPDPCAGTHNGFPTDFGPAGVPEEASNSTGACFDYRTGP